MIRKWLHNLIYPKAYRDIVALSDQAAREHIAKAFTAEVLILSKTVIAVSEGKAFDRNETYTMVRAKNEIMHYMVKFLAQSDHLIYVQKYVEPILDQFIIKRASGEPIKLRFSSEVTHSIYYLMNLGDLMKSGHLKANIS